MGWRTGRAARVLAAAVLLVVVGIVLLAAGVTAKTLWATDAALGRSANQVTVLVGALTIIGLPCSVGRWAWRRLRGGPASKSAQQKLREEVRAREQRLRFALLAGSTRANLAYASDAPAKSGSRFPRLRSARVLSPKQRAVERRLLPFTVVSARPSAGRDTAAVRRDLWSVGRHFSELENERLVVLGRPGAGKTVLAIELVLQLLDRDDDSAKPATGRIPVRLGAASWVPGQDLRDWIAQRLVLDYSIPAAAAAELAAGQELLPVLDGLDEMDSDPLGPAGPTRALALLAQLNAYSHGVRLAPVVITCRAGRYEEIRNAGAALQADEVITIGDLDTACLTQYLHQRYDADTRNLAIWDEVLDRLAEPVSRVLSTPWRLLLAVTAAQCGQDPRQLLAAAPGEDPAAAEQRISAALLAAYVPAATQLTPRRCIPAATRRTPRRRDRLYRAARVEAWLSTLAGHLDWQDAYAAAHSRPPAGMTGVDIVPHLLWPTGGLRLVRSLHIALSVLAAAAVSVFAYVDIGLASTRAMAKVVALTVVALALAAIGAARRWPVPEPSPRAARTRSHNLGGVSFNLGGVAVAAGAVVGVTDEVALIGLVAGLGLWLVLLLLAGTGLIGGSWTPQAALVSPMHALRRQLTSGFVVGFVFGLALGLALAPRNRSRIELGLELGVVFGVIFVGAWTRYALGQACAVAQRRLPLRLGRFLSWAQDSGLLRVSGATYQFRHRELQDWLRTRTVPEGQPEGSQAPVPARSP
jgi:NACHT domain